MAPTIGNAQRPHREDWTSLPVDRAGLFSEPGVPIPGDSVRHDGFMIQLSVRRVHPDQVDMLRTWFEQLETTRRAEAIATLIDETVSHETAVLISDGDQPILVYAMEVDDPEQARASADSGQHPIDAEHRAVLARAFAEDPPHETVLDLTP